MKGKRNRDLLQEEAEHVLKERSNWEEIIAERLAIIREWDPNATRERAEGELIREETEDHWGRGCG